MNIFELMNSIATRCDVMRVNRDDHIVEYTIDDINGESHSLKFSHDGISIDDELTISEKSIVALKRLTVKVKTYHISFLIFVSDKHGIVKMIPISSWDEEEKAVDP